MVFWNFDGDVDKVLLTDSALSTSFKKCVLDGYYDAKPEFSGGIGIRIVAIFVVMITSTLVTLLPIVSRQYNFKIPLYGYLFARYFGSGVILATAFVHLMDPAYGSIGPDSCVGGWGNWAVYSWPPALMLLLIFGIFLIELVSEVYVERKYGHLEEPDVEKLITAGNAPEEIFDDCESTVSAVEKQSTDKQGVTKTTVLELTDVAESLFAKQIAGFMILEFGVIFHSVIIGLNLGSAEYEEFKSLFIVVIFHQSFEGLGIGARLSTIPWPNSKPQWWKHGFCILYGMVTPVAIAIGIGIRQGYAASGFTANAVSGVLDSLSCGILIYTAMVEMLARDFVFNEEAKKDLPKLLFNIACTMVGCFAMALLGKWA